MMMEEGGSTNGWWWWVMVMSSPGFFFLRACLYQEEAKGQQQRSSSCCCWFLRAASMKIQIRWSFFLPGFARWSKYVFAEDKFCRNFWGSWIFISWWNEFAFLNEHAVCFCKRPESWPVQFFWMMKINRLTSCDMVEARVCRTGIFFLLLFHLVLVYSFTIGYINLLLVYSFSIGKTKKWKTVGLRLPSQTRTDKKQHPAEKILEEEVSLVIDTAASTMSQEPYSAMFFIHKD